VIQDGIKVSASTFINLDFLFSSLFIEKQVGPLSYTILLEDLLGINQPRPQGLPRGGARAEEDPGKIRLDLSHAQ
jgi:hypothetical protein